MRSCSATANLALTWLVVGHVRCVYLPGAPIDDDATVVAILMRATIHTSVIGVLVRRLHHVAHWHLGNVEHVIAKVVASSTLAVILEVRQSLDILAGQAVIVMCAAEKTIVNLHAARCCISAYVHFHALVLDVCVMFFNYFDGLAWTHPVKLDRIRPLIEVRAHIVSGGFAFEDLALVLTPVGLARGVDGMGRRYEAQAHVHGQRAHLATTGPNEGDLYGYWKARIALTVFTIKG